jgi:hypothetical protein
MVNKCEPLINVVSSNKPKVLTGLDQKVYGMDRKLPNLSVVDNNPLGEKAEPNQLEVIHTERGKLVFPLKG